MTFDNEQDFLGWLGPRRIALIQIITGSISGLIASGIVYSVLLIVGG